MKTIFQQYIINYMKLRSLMKYRREIIIFNIF